MIYAICLGLFLPLFGFLGLMTTANWIGRRFAGLIACSTIFLSFLSFIALFFFYTNGEISQESVTFFQWIHVAQINADFTLHIDHLSILMGLIITGIGFLIHLYSVGYVDHEEDFARYFSCLNLFIFFMLLLILAGNLLLLFVGWEGVGLASYLLIGFWYHRPTATSAAVKAFVVNRVGDLGFLLGLLLTFYLFGTSDILTVSQLVEKKFSIGDPLLTTLTLLFFIGAIGKSAQLPLHVWLPDAMEGPTPVSALIHAATMVTAGVYLVVRLHPLFMLAPFTLQIIGVLGAVTSLFAALCAVGQTDLKRVLAYSTISQLGLMFLACGAGAFYSAMFHLTTHAFVKALLFLAAGNVVHMMSGTTDMEKMGGLSKKFPVTHWLFLIGVFAMSGVPPLAVFFSKDLILEQEYLAGFKVLFYVGIATSILTAFYLTRAYCLTFTGRSQVEDQLLAKVKEAPRMMLIPVILLAFLALFGGVLGCTFGKMPLLEKFLAEIGVTLAEKELMHGFMLTPETLLAVFGAFFGIGFAALLYTRYRDRLGSPLPLLKKAFFVDDIYGYFIVVPVRAISALIREGIEPGFFDGSIRLTVQSANKISFYLQQIQSGQIRSYAAWTVLGSVFLLIYLAF